MYFCVVVFFVVVFRLFVFNKDFFPSLKSNF